MGLSGLGPLLLLAFAYLVIIPIQDIFGGTGDPRKLCTETPWAAPPCSMSHGALPYFWDAFCSLAAPQLMAEMALSIQKASQLCQSVSPKVCICDVPGTGVLWSLCAHNFSLSSPKPWEVSVFLVRTGWVKKQRLGWRQSLILVHTATCGGLRLTGGAEFHLRMSFACTRECEVASVVSHSLWLLGL